VRSERPDLSLVTIEADQGVGLVTGFNPDAHPPNSHAIQKYSDLDYSHLDENRRQLLGLRAPEKLQTVLPWLIHRS